MKEGRTIQELAGEIVRQAETKRDFLAPANQVEMTVAGDLEDMVDFQGSRDAVRERASQVVRPRMEFGTNGGRRGFEINSIAHGQLATHTGIPKFYYDRMLDEAPNLLAANVNRWLRDSTDKRMLRTVDGRLRAWLSDKYRPLDNLDLAEAILPILQEFGMVVRSSELTERKFYIKASRPDMTAEIRGSKEVGDIVEAGIVLSNSEVGAGSVAIQPMVYRLVCKNGAISNDRSLRKYHTGSRKGTDLDVAYELLTDETKKATDRAFWMQVQDLTRSALDGVVFAEQVRAMEEATGNRITGAPEMVVEVAAKQFGLNGDERGSVLRNLIDGGDLSQWGLANAITRMSQDVEGYDRATDLERLGGSIIELPKKDWMSIAQAA